ncbi:MAG: LysE family transporter [Candidatus Thorarchaeota archaeon]|nr:LysE family transporter [Candidatus Thorarchaeota archaeon]
MDVIVILAAWWALSLTGALAPGPLSAAVIMQSSQGGRLQGIMPMVGHSLVELGLVGAIVVSVSTIALDTLAISAMQGFGGVVVIGFGLLALKSWKNESSEGQATAERPSVHKSTLAAATIQGALVSILSPYFLLWWFAVGLGSISTLIAEIQVGVGTVLVAACLVYLTHISTDFMFGAFLTLGVDATRRRVRRSRVNWLSVAIGTFQIALGLLFVYEALTV